jgi:hypothetical protein
MYRAVLKVSSFLFFQNDIYSDLNITEFIAYAKYWDSLEQ